MTDHPITPPPELVHQWREYWYRSKVKPAEYEPYLTACAAQWGSDQELEACCEWIAAYPWLDHPELLIKQLRTARRSKSQTLNSIALQMLGTIERDAHYLPEITDTIRRALEALPE